MPMRTAVASAATRISVVDSARQRFTRDGYASTSIDDVARAAGVTKGAVYHHFGDKRELFEAAVRSVQDEVLRRVEEEARTARGTWSQLRAAVIAMLDSALSSDVRVLMLTEGPAVLGLSRWRELDNGGHVALISRFLSHAMDEGEIRRAPIGPLARLVRSVITEAALATATSDDPHRERRDMERALWTLLRALKNDD